MADEFNSECTDDPFITKNVIQRNKSKVARSDSVIYRQCAIGLVNIHIIISIIIIILVSVDSSQNGADYMTTSWKSIVAVVSPICSILFSFLAIYALIFYRVYSLKIYTIQIFPVSLTFDIVMMVALGDKFWWIGLFDFFLQIVTLGVVWKINKFMVQTQRKEHPEIYNLKLEYIKNSENRVIVKFVNIRKFSMICLFAKTVATIGWICLIFTAKWTNWIISFIAYFEITADIIGLYGIWNGILKFISMCFVYNLFVIVVHIMPMILAEDTASVLIVIFVVIFEVFVSFMVWKVYGVLQKVHYQQTILLPK